MLGVLAELQLKVPRSDQYHGLLMYAMSNHFEANQVPPSCHHRCTSHTLDEKRALLGSMVLNSA